MSNTEFWNSEAGKNTKDYLSKLGRFNHRPRTKLMAIDIETGEKHEIDGYDDLATFLGYKKPNASMRAPIRSNKAKTKKYKIIRR